MKILNCFLDNRCGGPQKRAYQVATKLRPYDIETLFLFNEKERGAVPVQHFTYFMLKRLQCLTRESMLVNFVLFWLLFPYNVYKVASIVKSEGIHVVHANGILNCIPVIAAALTKRQSVWHLNDTATPRWVRLFFWPLLLLLPQKIALASHRVGEYYFGQNQALWQKSFLLYAPIDFEQYSRTRITQTQSESLYHELGIRHGSYIVGAIGNINFAKGYEYFIRAAALVKQKVDNVVFIIVGSVLENKKYYYNQLGKLVSSLGLDNELRFVGYRDDIPRILSICNAFILSSVNEACPMALLEAIAMKVPVVATNVGGVNEMVAPDTSGIVVDPRNSERLAEGVFTLQNLSHEQLTRMTDAGYHMIQTKFSLDTITDNHKNMYTQLYS